MSRMAVWFEIPATDFERAVTFYEAVFDVTLKRETFAGNCLMGVFPCDGDSSGAVVQGPHYRPGADGVLLYLNGGDDLAVPLGRVAAAGGEVLVPKTLISQEIGWFAIFRDSEGNRIALHSRA